MLIERNKMKKSLELSYGPGESSIYDVHGTKEKFTILTSSLDKGWNEVNVPLLSLQDNGNGIAITFDGEKLIQLDYMQAELLRLALKINSSNVSLKEIEKRKFTGLK
jgi:hypothetical protein